MKTFCLWFLVSILATEYAYSARLFKCKHGWSMNLSSLTDYSYLFTSYFSSSYVTCFAVACRAKVPPDAKLRSSGKNCLRPQKFAMTLFSWYTVKCIEMTIFDGLHISILYAFLPKVVTFPTRLSKCCLGPLAPNAQPPSVRRCCFKHFLPDYSQVLVQLLLIRLLLIIITNNAERPSTVHITLQWRRNVRNSDSLWRRGVVKLTCDVIPRSLFLQ